MRSSSHYSLARNPKVLSWICFTPGLMWNRALATLLCAFCRPHLPVLLNIFQIEARNGENRHSTSATTEATLPAKTQGFTPECLFKPEFTRSPVDMMVKMLTMPTASSNYALAQWVFALNRALAEVSCTFCRANSTTQIQNRTESLSFLGLFLWNRAIATVSCTCCRANPTTQIQRCSLSLYKFLCEIALSLQSRAHFALRIRPQAAPNASFFHDFYVKPSSPYNIVRILPTSSSKSAPRPSIFFKHFQVQSELSQQSCAARARFVENFCRSRPATAETETLLRRPQKPLYPQKHRVSRQGFSSLNSRIPAQLLDDDVVDMILWLTWWWECCPWQSSVTRKLSS